MKNKFIILNFILLICGNFLGVKFPKIEVKKICEFTSNKKTLYGLFGSFVLLQALSRLHSKMEEGHRKTVKNLSFIPLSVGFFGLAVLTKNKN